MICQTGIPPGIMGIETTDGGYLFGVRSYQEATGVFPFRMDAVRQTFGDYATREANLISAPGHRMFSSTAQLDRTVVKHYLRA